jgi:ABC-type bacteriocin/lantibiotic exporter with double-glycine peptidase domain
MVTERFSALFEFNRAVKAVTNNFRQYVIALVMTLFYTAVYLVASIVLVGIPCLAFGANYFMVEFYRTARK